MGFEDGELPRGWAMVRVDRVGAVRLGRQRSPDKHTGEHKTKYLRAANITPSGLDLTDILEMDFTPAERAAFSLRAGDILLTEASGSSSQVGRAAIWRGELPECCYQNTVIRFRPHAVLPEYALVVFRHYAASGTFARVARGVGIQHLGGGRFAELQFPLPPLNEQRRIFQAVEQRLLEIREAEKHLRSAIETLEAQRKEVLASAVSGQLVPISRDAAEAKRETSKTIARIVQVSSGSQGALFTSDMAQLYSEKNLAKPPDGWVWVRIDQLGEVRLGRQRSPEHHHGDHMRPYLRVANVLEDRIDVSNVLEMNFTHDEYSTYALKEGDILLNEGQSPELVGRPSMFRNELPGVCFQNTLIRFRCGSAVDPEFALLVFLHYLHSGQFRSIARWSTNIAHLGLDRFRAMYFPVPPLAEQRLIAREARRRLSAIASQLSVVRTSVERLPQMERELLAAAVAGELTHQEVDDEPASELLDRVGVPRDAAAPLLPAGVRNTKEYAMKPKKQPVTKATGPRVLLSSVLRTAGRPLPLPELFALAGFDRDQSEHVEQFYLAMRSELNNTIRQVGSDAENALLEAVDAP